MSKVHKHTYFFLIEMGKFIRQQTIIFRTLRIFIHLVLAYKIKVDMFHLSLRKLQKGL
jgi:hypothetical protein